MNKKADNETGIDSDGPGYWYNEDGIMIYYELQAQQERQDEAKRIHELMTQEN